MSNTGTQERKKTFVSSKDESVPLFNNRYLDIFTRVHFTVPLIIFLPVVGFFLYRAVTLYQFQWYEILGLVAIGFFLWTLTEYVMHRFVFHWMPPGRIGARIHFLTHGVHHDYPQDSLRLVMVPTVSIPLAFLFYFLYWITVGPALASALFGGYVIGYLFYDMTHYAVHHWNFKSAYWQRKKMHHMKHHFQDPDHGYGVSFTLWDYVFGTTYPEKKK